MLSDRISCLFHFWWIVQAFVFHVCALLLKFDELSMYWNILFPSHRLFYTHVTKKGEISCKSCNSFKLTYRSFASLNCVQSRQSYKITRISFTHAKTCACILENDMLIYSVSFLAKNEVLWYQLKAVIFIETWRPYKGIKLYFKNIWYIWNLRSHRHNPPPPFPAMRNTTATNCWRLDLVTMFLFYN